MATGMVQADLIPLISILYQAYFLIEVVAVVAFSSLEEFWENVRPFIPSLPFFSFLFFFFSGD